MKLLDRIKNTVRDVPDFPKEGILFKDITPLLADMNLYRDIIQEFAQRYRALELDAVVGIESRGFWFGLALASALDVPFIPVRKEGKLPYDKVSCSYELEYGENRVEMHNDAIQESWKVLVHDDLLATGGTALAAEKLIQQLGGQVVLFSFLIELSFLKARSQFEAQGKRIDSLVSY